MRVIVMSDSHGSYRAVEKIVTAQHNADIFIHLGDGEAECSKLRSNYPDKTFYCLKGNCDCNSTLPQQLIIPVGSNHKIFASHGHNFNVKYSISMLLSMAKENSCDIILFGHTHFRYSGYEDGIYIINPGSCIIPRDGNPPSYAFIDVTDKGIFTNTVSI